MYLSMHRHWVTPAIWQEPLVTFLAHCSLYYIYLKVSGTLVRLSRSVGFLYTICCFPLIHYLLELPVEVCLRI